MKTLLKPRNQGKILERRFRSLSEKRGTRHTGPIIEDCAHVRAEGGETCPRAHGDAMGCRASSSPMDRVRKSKFKQNLHKKECKTLLTKNRAKRLNVVSSSYCSKEDWGKVQEMGLSQIVV